MCFSGIQYSTQATETDYSKATVVGSPSLRHIMLNSTADYITVHNESKSEVNKTAAELHKALYPMVLLV